MPHLEQPPEWVLQLVPGPCMLEGWSQGGAAGPMRALAAYRRLQNCIIHPRLAPLHAAAAHWFIHISSVHTVVDRRMQERRSSVVSRPSLTRLGRPSPHVHARTKDLVHQQQLARHNGRAAESRGREHRSHLSLRAGQNNLAAIDDQLVVLARLALCPGCASHPVQKCVF